LPTLSLSQTAFGCSEIGTVNITATATDVNMNTATCIAIVTVEDNIAPDAICQDVTVELDAMNSGSITAAEINNGSADACDVPGMTIDITTFTDANIGSNIVTLTVMDNSGNTSACTSNVTVSDSTPPVALCQDITAELEATGTVSILPTDIDNGSSDNVGIASMTLNIMDFSCTDLGQNTVELTVTDDTPFSSTCIATVTIVDLLPPVSSQPILNPISAQCSVEESAIIEPSATDNCGGVVTIANDGIFPITVSTTLTWTYTDQNGNSETQTQEIVINDTTAPTPICQDLTIELDTNGQAFITASDIDGGSTDNCSINGINIDQTDFTNADLGVNNVLLTVMDDAGFTASCFSVVTVQDNINPSAICQDITVQLDPNGLVSVDSSMVNNGSTDNGAIATMTLSETAFNCTDIGANTVTLTVADDAGNTSSCASLITVEDNLSPIVTCDPAVTFDLDGSGSFVLTDSDINVVATDNCSIDFIDLSQTSFDCSHAGSNTITVTATDTNGLSSTCESIVTINDTENPVAICQDITVEIDATGNVVIASEDINNGSIDNCNNITIIASDTTFTNTNLGANNITLTVTDGSGNTATCNAIVTVEDNIAPVAICQDITVDLDVNGNVAIDSSMVDNGSSDNGAIATMVLSQTDFTCANVGTNTVILNITDDGGNTAVCSSIVTVQDVTAPEISCLNMASFNLDAAGTITIDENDLNVIASDSCGIANVNLSQTTFDCTDAGINMITVTATDVNGMAATCTSEVTIRDIQDPIAICQDITVEIDATGNVTIASMNIDNGSSDNCNNPSILASDTTFTNLDLGNNSIILTVTDGSNNISTCTAIVTVEDNIAPVAVCQDLTINLDVTGNVQQCNANCYRWWRKYRCMYIHSDRNR